MWDFMWHLDFIKDFKDLKKNLTSTSTLSFSFLHVAEMVSVVPNSKYQSLFFILREGKKNIIRYQ